MTEVEGGSRNRGDDEPRPDSGISRNGGVESESGVNLIDISQSDVIRSDPM